MGVEAIIAGAGLMAYGQIKAGEAAAVEGESAEAIANYNAAVEEQNAKAMQYKAAYDQKRLADESSRVSGTLKTRLAKSGALLGVGTPLSLESEQQAELDLENIMIGFEADTQASRARSQAEVFRLGGQLAKQRGKNAKTASYVSAGGTFLTGLGMAGAFDPKVPDATKTGSRGIQSFFGTP